MRAAIGASSTINRLRWSGKGVSPKQFLLYQPEKDPALRMKLMRAQAEAFALGTGGKVIEKGK